ncbi:MAG: acetoin utilization protein AcuC [Hyphomicrobiales bacterium]|nr:acetoin utilization protein AcuC [Hyphomicrobiales bacterium]
MQHPAPKPAPHKRRPAFVHAEVYRRAAYGQNHPLAIARVETAVDLCLGLGWLEGGYHASPVASREQLEAFHAQDYIEALYQAEAAGLTPAAHRQAYNLGTRENPVFAGIFERASTSVGGSILAAELALLGGIAYHPAGGTHHGQKARASGFCYFNDPVFAILTCLDRGLERIVYVDLDAHHGDGVEDAFFDNDKVFTLSLHEAGRWPGTGLLHDRRMGRARNLPVPRHLNDSELDYLIQTAILPLVQRQRPQVLVITCGADNLAGDPLSTMDLSNGALWRAVTGLAACAPAVVVLGGGGYNPWTLGRAWAGLWAALNGFEVPERLPSALNGLLKGLTCDLVEDEDIRPEWLTTLRDPPNHGPVRDEIKAMADTIMREA